MSNRSKQRADEIVLLRDEVKRLHEQQERLEEKVEKLEKENNLLYRVLHKHGIDAEIEMEQLRAEIASARDQAARKKS